MKKLILLTLAGLIVGFVVSQLVLARSVNDILKDPGSRKDVFSKIWNNHDFMTDFMNGFSTNRNAEYMMMNYMMNTAEHDSAAANWMRQGIMGNPAMMNYMMGAFINRTDSDTALAHRFGYMMMGHRNMIGYMDNMMNAYGRNYMMNPDNIGRMPMYGNGYMNGPNHMYGADGMHNGNYMNGQNGMNNGNHMNGQNHMGSNMNMNGRNNRMSNNGQ